MARFICDFIPMACAHCGGRLQFDRLGAADFFAGCGHTCPSCGAHFEYSGALKVIAVANLGTADELADAIDEAECYECEGTKKSVHCGGAGCDECNWSGLCDACGGTGA